MDTLYLRENENQGHMKKTRFFWDTSYVFAARIVQSIGQKCITGVWGRSPQRKNGVYSRKKLEITYKILYRSM